MSVGRLFFDYLELWLSAAGLAVIGLMPAVLGGSADDRWRAAAVTAAVVGVLHGLIFWAVRTRQRAVRRKAIRDLQAVLRSRVNSKLSAAVLAAGLADPAAEAAVAAVADDISRLLGTLSEDTVRDWQARYGPL